jgi:hypothetical protein
MDFDPPPQKHNGDEHGGGIKIEMDTALGHAEDAVKIGGQGGDGDERLHGGPPVEETGETLSQDGKPAVEKGQGGQQPEGVGKIGDHAGERSWKNPRRARRSS